MVAGRFHILFFALLLAGKAGALELKPGDQLPRLEIEQGGELLLTGDTRSYTPWSVEQYKDRVVLLEYLAGHPTSKGLYQPVNDALEELNLDPKQFQVTAIINLADAIWGTQGIVVDEIVARKQRYPQASFIVDKKGVGQQAWNIQRKSGAIILIDAAGEVLFFQQGALTEADIGRLMLRIENSIRDHNQS